MHIFTALFDKLEDAAAVQDQLKVLGIVDLDDGAIVDRDHPDFDVDAYSTQDDRGIWGAPKMVFPPDEDRHLHEEHLRRGGYLLSVTVDDAEAAQVEAVLEQSNAVDVEERERQYKGAGYIPPAVQTTADLGEEVVPVVSEELRVGKRQVDRGGVKVRAYTVETPVREEVRLREEHVDVERRAIAERVVEGDDIFKERTLEATERSEEAVVGKEAHVVEEIVVRKELGERTETIKDTVRHTEVEVDQTGSAETVSTPRSV